MLGFLLFIGCGLGFIVGPVVFDQGSWIEGSLKGLAFGAGLALFILLLPVPTF